MTRTPPSRSPGTEAERLAAIIQSASDGIITVDSEHRIVVFNAAAERMFGYPAADVVGQRLDRFLPEAARARHDVFIAEFGRTGTATRPMGGDRILSALRADGTEFPIEAHISYSEVDGERLFTVILRDVTERQRADETRARLAALVESSDDAIIGKTLDGIVTSWNRGAERLFGYTADEMVGQSIRRLLPPERSNEVAHILEEIARGERVDHYETERVTKDGQRIDVSLVVSPIRDARGRIIGASKIARDITDRKRIEQQRQELLEATERARANAESASRAKDDFLSMISHELRTPLSTILAWTAVLRQHGLSADRIRDAVATIERAGHMQKELISDLLDVSRIVTGRLRLTRQHIDLRGIAETTLEAVRPDADHRGVRINAKLNENTEVTGDAVRLQQVIANLLGNAIKFTPRGGRITVNLTREDGRARLVISDPGRGIAPEFLPHVFDPFRQAENVRSRKEGGLGLGLAIARNLIEQHGGTITAASPGEGMGATFTIALPLAPAGVAQTSTDRPAPDLPRLDGDTRC